MSFDARERSLADGQPVRLYQFSRGAIRWSYNSSDRDITYQNQIFRTVQGGITDNGIIYSGDPQSDQFVITAPADLEVALLYKPLPPSDSISLVVYDMHYGDAEAAVSWVGEIGDVDWPTVDSCRISCVSEDELMDQPGLIDTYCRTCTAVLGDHRCKVNLIPHRVTLTPQSVSNWVISSGVVAGYADGWFTAGYVEWQVDGDNYDRRHIERHVGVDLYILGGTQGIPAGVQLRVYPGCDFLAATCDAKFGNLLNFRGINKLDGRSPFDGDQVW
ncbi:phage BR0599 family protein [Pseudomonas aeruginosa]|uniref:phage BR0599 family protein n=1 Tax=Pseudomonas aeruginosa TaxID=287 RepID=UPI000FC42D19|nr:phage BR0599 family protein [Pseudomonas aeruginosa]RUI34538.1 DUF2163 domain-containing protein [Pseudomonas aeruginosa]